MTQPQIKSDELDQIAQGTSARQGKREAGATLEVKYSRALDTIVEFHDRIKTLEAQVQQLREALTLVQNYYVLPSHIGKVTRAALAATDPKEVIKNEFK